MSEVEFAGGPAGHVRAADEAMASLSRHLGIPVDAVIEARNAGQLAALIETRQAQDQAEPLDWAEADRLLRSRYRVR